MEGCFATGPAGKAPPGSAAAATLAKSSSFSVPHFVQNRCSSGKKQARLLLADRAFAVMGTDALRNALPDENPARVRPANVGCSLLQLHDPRHAERKRRSA